MGSKKNKNSQPPGPPPGESLVLKSPNLRFFFFLFFLSWCAVVLINYTTASGFGYWTGKARAVINLDDDSPMAPYFETDAVIKTTHPGGYSLPGSPAATWLNNIKSLLVTAVMLLVCFSLGNLRLKQAKLDFSGRPENLVFSTALGLGILAYIILGLGAFSMLREKFITILMAALTLYSVLYLLLNHRTLFMPAPDQGTGKKGISLKLILFSIITFFIINVIGALSPETWYDAPVYHFAVPHYYLISNHIANMPYNIFSNIVGTVNLLFIPGFALTGTETSFKILNLFVSLTVCLSIYSFCRRYFKNDVVLPVLAAAIFYTVPLVSINAWRSRIEIWLALFAFLSMYAFINAVTDWERSGLKISGWFVLSAVFAGFTASIKYTGFFYLISITIAMIYYLYREKKSSMGYKIILLVVFLSVAVIIEIPWLVKNVRLKSNPVYPYMTSIFKKSKIEGDNIESFKNTVEKQQINSVKDWILLPWYLTFKSRTESPLNGPAFLCILPLALLFVFLKDPNPVFKNLMLISVIYYVIWSFLSFRARFLIPVFPAVAVIIAYMTTRSPSNIRGILTLVFAAVFLQNITNTLVRVITLNGWRAVFGSISREEYLSSKNMVYNAPSYLAISFINEKLPENAKVMFWGETRAFPCRKQPLVHTFHNRCPFDDYAREAADGNALYERLKKEGITHILWNIEETGRLKTPAVFFEQEKDGELKAKLKDFSTAHLKEILTTKWTRLFELKQPASDETP